MRDHLHQLENQINIPLENIDELVQIIHNNTQLYPFYNSYYKNSLIRSNNMTVELDESINKINSFAIDHFIDAYLKSIDYHFDHGDSIKEHLKYVIISNWKDFVILLNNKNGPIKVGIHCSIGNSHTQMLSDYFKKNCRNFSHF